MLLRRYPIHGVSITPTVFCNYSLQTSFFCSNVICLYLHYVLDVVTCITTMNNDLGFCNEQRYLSGILSCSAAAEATLSSKFVSQYFNPIYHCCPETPWFKTAQLSPGTNGHSSSCIQYVTKPNNSTKPKYHVYSAFVYFHNRQISFRLTEAITKTPFLTCTSPWLNFKAYTFRSCNLENKLFNPWCHFWSW